MFALEPIVAVFARRVGYGSEASALPRYAGLGSAAATTSGPPLPLSVSSEIVKSVGVNVDAFCDILIQHK
jgi:hypothetical protein